MHKTAATARRRQSRQCLIVTVLLAALPVATAMDTPDLLTSADLAHFDQPAADARLPYGTDPLQFGDLRLPPGPGPHPVAVFIHGGCWMAEYDIAHSSKLTAALARHGIASWSLEFRRVGNDGGGWPGTFADVAAGTDHLRVIAAAYNLDLGRVITMGHSSGGQLALWLAARKNLAGSGPGASADPLALQGVLGLAAAADFDYLHEDGTCDRAVDQLLGGSPAEYPQRYAWTDPVRLSLGDTPQRLLVGRHDDVWSPPARRYFAAARERGENVRLIEAPDSGHFELIDPDSSTWPLVLEAARTLLSANPEQR